MSKPYLPSGSFLRSADDLRTFSAVTSLIQDITLCTLPLGNTWYGGVSGGKWMDGPKIKQKTRISWHKTQNTNGFTDIVSVYISWFEVWRSTFFFLKDPFTFVVPEIFVFPKTRSIVKDPFNSCSWNIVYSYSTLAKLTPKNKELQKWAFGVWFSFSSWWFQPIWKILVKLDHHLPR